MNELLATDRAYSAASAKTDLVSGISAMFANDVAMAIPGGEFSESADEAIAALRAVADNARSRAEWVPVGGGISADGLQGYTWGYMTILKADNTTTPAKYLSYWVKRPGGWRVAAYRRRLRPAGGVSLTPLAPSLPARMLAPSTGAALIAGHRASLDATERAFSDDAKLIGLGVAFARYGRPDSVNMGGANDAAFVVGAEAIGRIVSGGSPAEPSTLVWAPDRVIVASSGDLGVTIGLIRETAPSPDPNAPKVFPFFTVWQRASPADPWRYVAE
ncbi:MAG TPA: nuclear transport factor 2 family protein [Casimicrobiaceae bacterium]|nr:nuclear transport factor 2 family protein [Casimicrobiaceae bacterium]